ncbi:unnamed protein product [Rotaria magnacalcarata]|uniref:Reverse transcriptase domain-containing protein n=1 Tax=Rotaria magnacalcarata TaxID=392030 RepID=A0A816X1Y7_9BILA|nr:unnamed protein product [Rotaria magnacalcarata]CAF4083395.1 unnamed protein product [Rotaria magnacalcarata]
MHFEKKIIGFRRRSDDNKRGWCRRSKVRDNFSHIFPSSPIIEVASSLTSKHYTYLTNGPKYVPPCQSRFRNQNIYKIIQREHNSIVQSFKTGLTNNCISYSDQRVKEFFTAIENVLRRLYTTPLPSKLLARTQYEYRLIRSSRHHIKKSNIIIRPTDKSKVLHLGSIHDYHRKALQYMSETNAYKEITSGINPCHNHLQMVLTLIDPMLKNKDINLQLWKQYMRPNEVTMELAHLYFIPKPHKIGTPLRPIVSSIKAAATGVSHFLDILLRPMFNQATKETTFINGIDFVRQIENYRNRGRLLPTTLFVTFDITNLYTMIPRDGAIAALQKFLSKYADSRRIHGMTIDTITRLARLVLDTNCFVYDNKYYQQIRGGAMGSPFTMTLANAYMWEWEQTLLEYQRSHNEMYGRYIDDIFMTTNLSFDEINVRLIEANQQDENIRLTHTISSKVEYLDVLVENDNGQLKTSVYHKLAAEPYILPFSSDHPRHVHRSTINARLIRAIRLCSHLDDFDKERINIEFTLLLNGYPPKFISYYFNKIFQKHNVLSVMENLDNIMYEQLHRTLLLQPTIKERQQHEQQQQNIQSKDLFVHYTFESGPLVNFTKQLKHLWNEHYINKNPIKQNIRLRFGTKSNKNLCQLLVKKKPSKSLLRDSISSD